MAKKAKKVPSPCIGVCKIDRTSGFCVGCARTPAEIRRWKRVGDEEKRLILAGLAGRMPVEASGKQRTHSGGCHCGNVAVVFKTRRKRKALRPRACQCGFCRAHGARTVADPEGALRIAVANAALCSFYRFGLQTAEYLVCRDCGVYVAAVMRDGDAAWATLKELFYALRETAIERGENADHYQQRFEKADQRTWIEGWKQNERFNARLFLPRPRYQSFTGAPGSGRGGGAGLGGYGSR